MFGNYLITFSIKRAPHLTTLSTDRLTGGYKLAVNFVLIFTAFGLLEPREFLDIQEAHTYHTTFM